MSSLSYSQSILYNFQLVNKNFVDTIPIEFIHNKIFIPVKLNNRIYHFILDTGASCCALHNNSIASQSDTIGEMGIVDVNNNVNSTFIVSLPYWSIGNITIKKGSAITLDEMPFSCLGIDGVIGANILKNLIVKIDILNKHVILTDKKDFFKAERVENCSFKTYADQRPFIQINPTKKIKEEVLFDTGNNIFYTMNFRSYEYIKKRTDINIIDKGYGTESIGAFGHETDTLNYMLQLNNFKVDKFTFKNVQAALSQNSNSSIGADILNYGSIILDYTNKKMTFSPYHSDFTVKDNHSPFSIVLDNGKIKVGLVWEKSNEYRMGLRNGFIIKQANNIMADDACRFLSEWENLKGNVTLVCLNTNGEKITFKFYRK